MVDKCLRVILFSGVFGANVRSGAVMCMLNIIVPLSRFCIDSVLLILVVCELLIENVCMLVVGSVFLIAGVCSVGKLVFLGKFLNRKRC